MPVPGSRPWESRVELNREGKKLVKIQEAKKNIETEPEKRAAQRLLAETLTTMVHGADACSSVTNASAVLFSKDPADLN